MNSKTAEVRLDDKESGGSRSSAARSGGKYGVRLTGIDPNGRPVWSLVLPRLPEGGTHGR
jgi:hypothetical protein